MLRIEMGSYEIVLRLLAGVILILSNAFFVAIEFALTRLRQFGKKEIPDTPGAQRAWKMTEELEINLTGCQVGISLTSILLGVVAEPAFTKILRPLFEALGLQSGQQEVVSVVVGIVILNLVHKIWGEQAPTYLGVERPLEVCTYLGLPFFWWIKICYPVILFGDGLAKWTLSLFGVEVTRSWTEEGEDDSSLPRESLKASLISVLRDAGVNEDRREEVAKALEIDDIPLQKIMVGRDEIVALDPNLTFAKNIQTIRESMHSRYPVKGDKTGTYSGTLYTPQLLANFEDLADGRTTLCQLACEIPKLPDDCPVSKAIDHLQEAKQELAVVQNSSDEVVGVITLTDLFEVIVGEAEDPLD